MDKMTSIIQGMLYKKSTNSVSGLLILWIQHSKNENSETKLFWTFKYLLFQKYYVFDLQ